MQLDLSQTRFFQEKYLPGGCALAGFSALVQALDVQAPVRAPACVSDKRMRQSIVEGDQWRIFDNKYKLEPTVEAHLTFALKHEALDLLVLKRIFEKVPPDLVAGIVRTAPTGPVSRRLWFLYEFLLDKRLDLPDCGKVTAVDILDEKAYFTAGGALSPRHKVRNNLLGNSNFCPIIRRTDKLQKMVSGDLSARAKEIISHVSPQLLARAASFLLLADSQASFAIEGERLLINKEERWLRAVQQAGRHRISTDELDRLHQILIEDRRFAGAGFRKEGVFLGSHTQDGTPLPEFIGARWQDVPALMQGLIDANNALLDTPLDAVLQATAIAFGFVYIHPYVDGNGRLHRCLIHQVLAEKNFSPPGITFPVSSVMEKNIDRYRHILQNHTGPLMPFITWFPTESGNVDVTNDTADLYRYFDCTEEAEFLYDCVLDTIEHDVPKELLYLQRHDRALRNILNRVEMPNRLAESFITFMRQNDWQLPRKRREKEFAPLSDEEIAALTEIVRDAFVC